MNRSNATVAAAAILAVGGLLQAALRVEETGPKIAWVETATPLAPDALDDPLLVRRGRALTGVAILVSAALALGAAPGVSLASAPAIEVGRPFPDLALGTLDGEVRRVSDFRGTKLVLHVFASW